MKRFQLVEHVGAYETRYIVDGRRVSRERFNALRDRATRLECLQTKAKQVGTTFRRTNYSIAVFADA